jgi:hypothetical protein
MTHRQTPTAPDIVPAEDTTLSSTIRAFLHDRFADQAGWLCLGWIDGDPQIEPLREEWYHMPRQAHTLTGRAVELAERGYNLYVALCLFAIRRRSYVTALPSRWLWIDDAVVEDAEVVESSAGNFQSWLKLDQPLGAQERSALQRALRDTTAGADTCSADAVHMARLPGGTNRKQHRAWQVRIVRPVGAVLSVADLRRRAPICSQQALQLAHSDWHNLPKGSHLAQTRRFTALLRANRQLRKVCAGERVPLRMRNGREDNSLSNQRAIFVCQLIHARYPHQEIRALADHFRAVLASRPDRFETDIDQLLQRYTPAQYRCEPTRCITTPDQPPPPRGGRHYTLTAGELLELYHQYADCGPRGIVLEWTRAEVAQHLGVSHDTVQRREAELIKAGQIQRGVSDDRQRSFVILSPHSWNVDAQRISVADTDALLADANPNAQRQPGQADAEQACAGSRCEERVRAEITHHPHEPAATPSPPVMPTLSDPAPASVVHAGAVGRVCFPAPAPAAVRPGACTAHAPFADDTTSLDERIVLEERTLSDATGASRRMQLPSVAEVRSAALLEAHREGEIYQAALRSRPLEQPDRQITRALKCCYSRAMPHGGQRTHLRAVPVRRGRKAPAPTVHTEGESMLPFHAAPMIDQAWNKESITCLIYRSLASRRSYPAHRRKQRRGGRHPPARAPG